MTSTTAEVSAVTWECFETEPVFTTPMGAVDYARELMDSGDYRAVTIKDEVGRTVTEWTQVAGKWLTFQDSKRIWD